MVDDIYYRLVVAKAVSLATNAQTPVLVKSTSSGRRVIKLIDNSASRAPPRGARRKMDVILNKTNYTFPTNMSSKPAHIPKHMIAAHVGDSPAFIIAAEAALLKPGLNRIDAMHCKPSRNRDTQMIRQEDIGKEDD